MAVSGSMSGVTVLPSAVIIWAYAAPSRDFAIREGIRRRRSISQEGSAMKESGVKTEVTLAGNILSMRARKVPVARELERKLGKVGSACIVADGIYREGIAV